MDAGRKKNAHIWSSTDILCIRQKKMKKMKCFWNITYIISYLLILELKFGCRTVIKDQNGKNLAKSLTKASWENDEWIDMNKKFKTFINSDAFLLRFRRLKHPACTSIDLPCIFTFPAQWATPLFFLNRCSYFLKLMQIYMYIQCIKQNKHKFVQF